MDTGQATQPSLQECVLECLSQIVETHKLNKQQLIHHMSVALKMWYFGDEGSHMAFGDRIAKYIADEVTGEIKNAMVKVQDDYFEAMINAENAYLESIGEENICHLDLDNLQSTEAKILKDELDRLWTIVEARNQQKINWQEVGF